MADTATLVRSNAHILTLAGRRAAPIPTPSSSFADTTDARVIAMQAQVESSLAAALKLMRNPQGNADDLQRAAGRVCRAATLMRRLCAAQQEGVAA